MRDKTDFHASDMTSDCIFRQFVDGIAMNWPLLAIAPPQMTVTLMNIDISHPQHPNIFLRWLL